MAPLCSCGAFQTSLPRGLITLHSPSGIHGSARAPRDALCLSQTWSKEGNESPADLWSAGCPAVQLASEADSDDLRRLFAFLEAAGPTPKIDPWAWMLDKCKAGSRCGTRCLCIVYLLPGS